MKWHYLGHLKQKDGESQADWLKRILSVKHFLVEVFIDDEFRVYTTIDSSEKERAYFVCRKKQ